MSGPCLYLKLSGERCGSRCWENRCHIHRKGRSAEYCKNGCGRGTRSASGYCSKCSNKAASFHNKTYLAKRKREAAAMAEAQAAAELDAYVAWLVDTFKPCLLTPAQPSSGAPPAT